MQWLLALAGNFSSRILAVSRSQERLCRTTAEKCRQECNGEDVAHLPNSACRNPATIRRGSESGEPVRRRFWPPLTQPLCQTASAQNKSELVLS
jgi:hypothetical protein